MDMNAVVEKNQKNNSFHPVKWGIGLLVTAIYQLSLFALKKGGSVEVELGPLKYRINGKREEKFNAITLEQCE